MSGENGEVSEAHTDDYSFGGVGKNLFHDLCYLASLMTILILILK